MDSLAWFGLSPSASQRDVKRAYAQRLKQTRPDSDPDGFQELHERYREALAELEFEAMYALTTVDAKSAPAPAVANPAAIDATHETHSTVESPPEDFDWPDFRDALAERVATSDTRALRPWLDAQPALWSLSRKAEVCRMVFDWLCEESTPMSKATFDVVADFFHQREIDAEHDAFWIQRLGSRLDLRWRMLPGNEHALNVYARNGYNDPDAGLARARLDALSHPLSLWTALRFGLSTYGPDEMIAFVDGLDGGRRDLPPPIRQDQIAFWTAAADGDRLAWPRVVFLLARCALLGLAFTALMLLLQLPQAAPWPLAITMGFGVAWLTTTTGVKRYMGWQCAHEYADVFAPWLRIVWIPLLVAAGFILAHVTGRAYWSHVLAGLAAATSIFRYLRRNESPITIYGWMGYVFMIMLLFPVVSGALAVLLWGLDAWHHRRVLVFRRRTASDFEVAG